MFAEKCNDLILGQNSRKAQLHFKTALRKKKRNDRKKISFKLK